MAIDDGGPANPIPGTQIEGITIRDYFAVMAMPGIVHLFRCWKGMPDPMNHAGNTAIARESYKMADAMLAARQPEAEADPKGEVKGEE